MTYKKFGYLTASLLVIATVLVGAIAGLPNRNANASPSKQDSNLRTIVVSGTGNVTATPDLAYINLGVDSVNADVTVAVDDANARMQAILDALKGAGIDEADIRTDVYNIYQDYLYQDPTAAEPQRVFRVSILVNVTVRDITQVGALLTTALEAGANAVNGITFAIADRAAFEAEARKLALADARTKADQLAGEIGVTIVAPHKVEEYVNFGGPVAYDAAQGRGGAAPVSTGSLTVSLSVTVTYTFE